MSSQDDGSQRVALFLVFGLVALVSVSVISFGVHRAGASSAEQAPAVIVILKANEPDSMDDEQASAQALTDGASVQVEQGVVKFYFASGNADLAADAAQALAGLVEGAKSGRKLVISGFHDATGGAAQNAGLARQRALAVRNTLMAAGVAEAQIDLKKSEQVSGRSSDAQARRVEISLQ
jgi:outer membrane protein OmpA-like peptidoglycan-associated protein